jgi:site-specific DNA recombinase
MTRIAIYTRVSTTEQDEGGYGLDTQLAKCEAMATVKGSTAVAILSDSISGTKDESKRDGLAKLLQMAENKEIDCVIISALDRLGRNTRLVLSLVEKLEIAGIDLISCKESLDTSTPSGRFVLRMFASLAELERDSIVERTTSGRNQRAKVDGEKGGRVPWGYNRFDDSIIINMDAAQLVRQLFTRSDSGESMNSLANWLNDKGIKTPRGGNWYASSIKIVLANREKYAGGLRGDSNVHWPKIL